MSLSLFTRISGNQFLQYITKTVYPSLQRSFHVLHQPSTYLIQSSIPNKTVVSLNSKLLNPTNLIVNQVASFKVKGRLKRRCKDCQFVLRQQRLYVICKTHPRHKQMAMRAHDDKFWILTHATQSKIRPY